MRLGTRKYNAQLSARGVAIFKDGVKTAFYPWGGGGGEVVDTEAREAAAAATATAQAAQAAAGSATSTAEAAQNVANSAAATAAGIEEQLDGFVKKESDSPQTAGKVLTSVNEGWALYGDYGELDLNNPRATAVIGDYEYHDYAWNEEDGESGELKVSLPLQTIITGGSNSTHVNTKTRFSTTSNTVFNEATNAGRWYQVKLDFDTSVNAADTKPSWNTTYIKGSGLLKFEYGQMKTSGVEIARHRIMFLDIANQRLVLYRHGSTPEYKTIDLWAVAQ